jgi:Tfp pilus assembly protein PilZ
MQRRALVRINTSINSRLFHSHAFYSAVLLNLSEKGMFIRSKKCIPVDTVFVVLIRVENELMLVVPRVRWTTKTGGAFSGMGAEILSPKKDYLRFVEKLRHKKD